MYSSTPLPSNYNATARERDETKGRSITRYVSLDVHSSCIFYHAVTRNNRLDVGRVKHDTDRCAERLGREVVAELCSYDTGVTVSVAFVRIPLIHPESMLCLKGVLTCE